MSLWYPFIGLIKDELVYFSEKETKEDFSFHAIVSNSSLRKKEKKSIHENKGSQMSSHISEELLLKSVNTKKGS